MGMVLKSSNFDSRLGISVDLPPPRKSHLIRTMGIPIDLEVQEFRNSMSAASIKYQILN